MTSTVTSRRPPKPAENPAGWLLPVNLATWLMALLTSSAGLVACLPGAPAAAEAAGEAAAEVVEAAGEAAGEVAAAASKED